ncbi:gluconate 2-dehydrogenase subunit 3 family protein [Jiangella asiatica]|uniref:Gluconate 2-dehydrogenase subunit 3 family protein n=1 Tax=Jiangella asiatica TaxID=2530372 RepID=A0A4R5DGV3_9ACTN|nr:gluconate 2-dehydrogenase subunit 3 family protein [Jiangella asiatica]TDE09673.1 gluconate 2-dehydrogenase subunit 3 family protein [Jiangella asiatica]
MGQADWAVVPISAATNEQPLFFTSHEWNTVDAATARIIPTDRHPGAREARVVRFIDRMLAGIDFVYASADGSGFLQLTGKERESWEERIRRRGELYRQGVQDLDELADTEGGAPFAELGDDEQDRVLERLSGAAKPGPYELHRDEAGGGGAPAGNQPMNEDFLDFFPLLVLNTRQGFYADPVYGGNIDRIGWRVIGFDGPPTLKSTTDGSYTTAQYMIPEAEWPYERHPAVLRYHRP